MAEENNIGASRLLGTNGLQQAVDSLTTQVGKMSSDINRLVSSMDSLTGSNNRASGSSSYSSAWNAGSNSSRYGSNGGGARFSGTGSQGGRNGNGGGGSFGSLASGSRLSAGIGTAMAVGGALVNYANKNMSTNMLMDYTATQSVVNGGWGSGGQAAARQLANAQFFQNQYGALNAQDAAQAAAINQYTFGNSQFNGVANGTYTAGARQVGSFAYASPTLGMTAAAQAAQQTYAARSVMMGQALGLGITPGTSMSQIAQNIFSRTFGNQKISQQNFSAATRQGGSLAVNLQYIGQQLGWNQQTQQEYQGILQGQVTAQNNGMSSTQYYKLLGQAQSGNKSAQAQLSKATGLGTSMFETQRNLNATNLTRQSDILNSLAPAFDKATNAVNQLSGAITSLLQATGLDKLIGGAAGGLTPFSNAAGSVLNTLGVGGGIFAASRLLTGGGGGAGLFSQLFGKGGGGVATGTQAADGAYNITTMGAATTAETAMTAAAPVALTVAAAAGAASATQKSMWQAMYNQIKSGKYGGRINPFDKKSPVMPKNWTLADYDAYQAALNAPTGSFGPLQWNLSTNRGDAWTQSYINAHPGGGMPTQSGGGSSDVVGNTPGNGASNLGANAMQVIGYAKKELGVPYGWGMESPGKAFDCSGLTQWAYGQAGVKIPRIAADQQKTGTSVSVNNTQPGDLLFVGNPAHHVVMNAGGGMIIEAPHTGADVRMRALNPSEYDSATRIVGSIGSASGSQQTTATTLNQLMSTSGGDIGSYSGTSELANLQAALATIGGAGAMPASSQANGSGNSTGATTGATGGTPTANGNNSKAALQAYAKQLLASYGWAGEWSSFNNIVMAESGWDVTATNPSSGAYGIPQSLPASKMSSAGADWKTNGDTQLRWMMSYIKGRYGDPNQAWSFHQANNSYAVGAWNITADQTATVHQGEMIIPAQQAETIRQVLMNNTFNPNLARAAGVGQSGNQTIQINVPISLPSNFSGSYQDAQTIGNTIATAIASNQRIKDLQKGQ